MPTVRLAWPPRELSPNARVHHMARAKATKAYRTAAHWAGIAAGLRAPETVGDIRIDVEFHPPSRRIDRQNCPGWIKAAIDGLADAMCINDRRFAPVYSYGEPVKGGAVVVTIP